MGAEKTKHALLRQDQRGIKDRQVEAVFRYGEEFRRLGNSSEIVMTDKNYKMAIESLSIELKESRDTDHKKFLLAEIELVKQSKDICLVLSEYGEIITIYKNRKRRKLKY